MIFTEIVLHNFGIYKGRHIVNLRPESIRKPIILFGGLNGGGKTTFLDALQLTLYGKFAKCSNRGGLSYNEYLKEAINRHADPKDGAALELELIYYSEGDETVLRIKRLWKSVGKTIKETVEVFKDGCLDEVMSKQWYEFVDEFMPYDISALFFFDGEKIEDLANPESSAGIIRTGIMSLLGLDLVDKLHNDLRTLERRHLAQQIDSNVAGALSQIEKDVNQLEQRVQQHKEKVENKNSEIDRLDRKVNSLAFDYRKHGGELYEQREVVEEKYRNCNSMLKKVENDIRKFAEGSAPLWLVKDLLQRAQEQSEKEKETLENRDASSIFKGRDLEIINQFAEQTGNHSSVVILDRIFENDRTQRNQSAKQPTPLNIHAGTFKPFDQNFFTLLQDEARYLRLTHKKISGELAVLDTQLSMIPDADSIKRIAQQLVDTKNELLIVQGELNTLQRTYDDYSKELSGKLDELDRFLYQVNDEQLGAYRSKRIMEHIAEVQRTLTIYRTVLIGKHIGKLQSLIKDSFGALVHKSDLVNDIYISPDNFSLSLINKQGELISTERLSAGERQLLAVSILWGLAKASGRPLPVVIDTPLGRLDSKHRRHLIDNYFPNASHQVILLSTDTEIDYEYRDILSENIDKEYHIQYRKQEKSSTINPGYV